MVQMQKIVRNSSWITGPIERNPLTGMTRVTFEGGHVEELYMPDDVWDSFARATSSGKWWWANIMPHKRRAGFAYPQYKGPLD